MIQRIEYFKYLSKEALHDVMYFLRPRYYEKGDILLRPDDHANTLLFIEEGLLEIYTKMEGNEFVIEKLYKGSAINFRAFFMDDTMYVHVRCAKNTTLLALD
jgi:signal-transduction protein with cAMP-binding, CBS, and nucleotidyltransferase domain